jgi:hypothetical protein
LEGEREGISILDIAQH